MKGRIISYLLLLAVIIAVSIPLASAYMVKQTEKISNVIEIAQVSCSVSEKFDGQKKTSVTINNTSNIEAYIRVRVVSYWQDSKGNTVARASEMPEFTVSNAWIADTANQTYYCKTPIKAGDATPEFLANNFFILLRSDTQIHNDVVYEYHQVVEIIAEAIQSLPADAVTSSWGVTVDTETREIIDIE